jgi:hypothetical protein
MNDGLIPIGGLAGQLADWEHSHFDRVSPIGIALRHQARRASAPPEVIPLSYLIDLRDHGDLTSVVMTQPLTQQPSEISLSLMA